MVFKKLLKGKKEGDGEGAGAHAAPVEEQATYHADADENGGMLCTNDELLKQQREAIMQWIKSMGKRLLTGNINLINTPFPVTIFEPRSYLEKLADVWVYPRYLTAAAAATDPLERMKLVTTWFIAGLHHAFSNWRKPFNPILGETWQAHLSDGSSMYMEQISHHPPVSAFHMEGPGGSYRFRGLSQPTVSILIKYYGFKTVAKGYRYVEFNDGTRIELHYPQYVVKNVVYASRPRAEVDGQAILVDVRNKLKTVISFGPLKGARSKVLRRNDAVCGFIYDCKNHQASLEEKTSTADLAEVLDEQQRADARRHPHGAHLLGGSSVNGSSGPPSVGPGGSGPGSAGAGGDRGGGAGPSGLGRDSGGDEQGGHEEEEFESASENEYDPEREGADAAAELERAAAEAAALALDDELGVGALGGGGLAEPLPSPALPGGATPAGASNSGPLAELAGGRGSGGAGGGPPSGGDKGGGGSSSSSSSFFGMGAFNRMGTILRLSQAPAAVNAEPVPDEGEGQAMCGIQGSWLGHVALDGVRYWTIAERADAWRPVADPLPSDCRYRQDLVALAGGDLKASQRAKEALENMQRGDKKVRDAVWGGARH